MAKLLGPMQEAPRARSIEAAIGAVCCMCVLSVLWNLIY